MSFLQVPPPTRYDLNFNLVGFRVRVHPLFWLLPLFFGASSGNIALLLIWVVAVFISILIHELGHSLAMRFFGQDSYIVLHLFGGLAVPTSDRGGRWGNVSPTSGQEIMISFAGPLAGFVFAAVILALAAVSGGSIFVSRLFGVIPMPSVIFLDGGWIANSVVQAFLWINVFWGLVNLMPVFPLDGGNIARHLFIQADPWDGVRKSLWLSTITGTVLAIAGFILLNSIYLVLLFGILALQSYQMMQGRGLY